MDETKVKTLVLQKIEDLLHLLEHDPSFELVTALHRLCLKYSLEPAQENASRFFFRISVFDESKLDPQYQPHLEILRATATHARSFDTFNYKTSQKREAQKFANDEGLISFLHFLSASGSTRAGELQSKMGTTSGFERIVKRCLDNKLIHVYKSDVLPDLVSITFKGRRVLTYLD